MDLRSLAEALPEISNTTAARTTFVVQPEVETEEVEDGRGRRYRSTVYLDLTRARIVDDSAPVEIADSLDLFRRDHPEARRVGFLMMQFGLAGPYMGIAESVRAVLERAGLECVRADDREYHPDLYWNVMTCIYGTSFGVAVFERLEEEAFNPNVSFEVGYAMALGRPVCLLKDRTLRQLHSDLIGKLYRVFDPFDVESSVQRAVGGWLRDKGLA